jgi:N,N'-diacetyllegionaminate synthase
MSVLWDNEINTLLIAEIGGNHEGDFEYAKHLTKLACESKAHAVKFQIYTGDGLVSSKESPDRNKHFKKFELSQANFVELYEICKKHGKYFSASVWEDTAMDWIDQYLSFYKIGSGDLTAYPILYKTAQKNKPIILSTGLSTLEDVRGAVDFLQQANPMYKKPENLILLQCTSMYPIPDHDANLNVMKTFSAEFNLNVGYSDHTIGSKACEVAYAMGAKVLEFHFTDSREGKQFRDHQVSLTQAEVNDLYESCRQTKILQGSFEKKPTSSELDNNHVVTFRRAIYLKRPMQKGSRVGIDDLVFLRPCHGIDARAFRDLVGKTLKTDVNELTALNHDMFVSF